MLKMVSRDPSGSPRTIRKCTGGFILFVRFNYYEIDRLLESYQIGCSESYVFIETLSCLGISEGAG